MKLVLIVVMCALASCGPFTQARYTPPEASGLLAVRAYPAEDDICQVVGENDLTLNYLDDAALLIGCPAHELGAIADRKAAGAREVAIVGAWHLLSVPLR